MFFGKIVLESGRKRGDFGDIATGLTCGFRT